MILPHDANPKPDGIFGQGCVVLRERDLFQVQSSRAQRVRYNLSRWFDTLRDLRPYDSPSGRARTGAGHGLTQPLIQLGP
jgi:hypothetical protein